jgi:hypothetical protein
MSFAVAIIAVLIIGLGGLYVGVVAYKAYSYITVSNDAISLKELVKISAFAGVSSTLLFLGIILVMGIIDGNYVWSIQKVFGAIVVSLIPGVITTLGSIYKVYSTIKYRDMLMNFLTKRSKS